MPFFQDATNTTSHHDIFNDAAGTQTNIHTTNNHGVTGDQYIFNFHGDIIAENPLRGIVHNFGNRACSHLPLEHIHIDVSIVDVSARVTLKQTFSNFSELATGNTKYVFPVPARAAVCAFEMHFGDGSVVTGISKERDLAAEEYENAVRAGKASGLIDQVTDDVFIISVGSIPASQTVTTNLVFVMDLMDDELKGEVRLQLPMSVGSRYGPEPDAIATAVSAKSQTRLRISVAIQMSGFIRQVTSPTHPNIKLAYVTARGRTSNRRRTAQLCSPTFLTQSFVLVVRADGLDVPRCFAERDNSGSGTVAMQLTFVPDIKLTPISAQEYLFLVDRSGSMNGPSIEIVKEALVILLRLLPKENTFFNIFSFGSSVQGLWQTSQPYDQNSLDLGTRHINSMTANYGGTELQAALEFAFESRGSHISTMVFVLTDGQVYSSDQVISAAADAVARSGPDAPLRVFALGIGQEVSSAVIEGLARVGNGESLFAVENESIQSKCAKLLRAGRSPCVETASIDWGVPENAQLGSPPSVQQSPRQIQKLFPGMRCTIFALTTHRIIPKQVIIRGKPRGEDGQIVIVVPVSSVKRFSEKGPDILHIHTLSASHLITDLMEGRASLPTTLNSTSLDDARKAAVVQLGEKYQLASRYTSFVAVCDETNRFCGQSRDDDSGWFEGTPKLERPARTWRPGASSDTLSLPGTTSTPDTLGAFYGKQESDSEYATSSTDTSSSQSSPVERPWSWASDRNTLPPLGRWYPSSGGRRDNELVRERAERGPDSKAQERVNIELQSNIEGAMEPEFKPGLAAHRLANLQQSPTIEHSMSRASCLVPTPLLLVTTARRYPTASVPRARNESTPPFELVPDMLVPASSRPPTVPISQTPRQVIDLVQLQNYDGSFSLSQSLGNVVGQPALQKPADVQSDDSAWATALAVAFLQKHLLPGGHSDLLNGILNKVLEFLGNKLSKVDFASMVELAAGLML